MIPLNVFIRENVCVCVCVCVCECVCVCLCVSYSHDHCDLTEGVQSWRGQNIRVQQHQLSVDTHTHKHTHTQFNQGHIHRIAAFKWLSKIWLCPSRGAELSHSQNRVFLTFKLRCFGVKQWTHSETRSILILRFSYLLPAESSNSL